MSILLERQKQLARKIAIVTRLTEIDNYSRQLEAIPDHGDADSEVKDLITDAIALMIRHIETSEDTTKKPLQVVENTAQPVISNRAQTREELKLNAEKAKQYMHLENKTVSLAGLGDSPKEGKIIGIRNENAVVRLTEDHTCVTIPLAIAEQSVIGE